MRGISILPRAALGLVSAPGASYAMACAVAAIVAAAVVAEAGPVVWSGVGIVVMTLGLDFAVARPSDRIVALRTVRRLAVTAGAGTLLASSMAWVSPADVRWVGLIVVTAGTVFTGFVLLARTMQAPRSVLLVGGRVGTGQLAAQWASCPDIEVRGVCLPEFFDESAQEIGLVPILGSLDDAVAVAKAIDVDEVVVVPGPLLSAYHVRRLSWELENSAIDLSVAAELEGVVARRITPRVLGRRVTLTVQPGRRSRPALWVKGIVDRIAAAILLVILSPLCVLVAMIIRLDSPGPAMFRQTRVGLDGKVFTIYKFRTMLVDAESRLAELTSRNEAAGPLFKMASDPRTTGVGRVLRSSSIDEVPQLINVLKGEMSLIGPRPGLPGEAMMYDEWIHRRLRVKPGMTGAWQVGGRSNLSWTDSVRLDIDYVDNATLRDDVMIAMRTARVVISREGAV